MYDIQMVLKLVRLLFQVPGFYYELRCQVGNTQIDFGAPSGAERIVLRS